MKRLTILFFSIILTAISGMQIYAAEFSVLQPKTVIAGNNFTVTFRLKDGQGTSLQAPEIEGCKLMYGPATSTMQSYQNINGRATSTVTIDYTYTYKAENEGTYTIPAASIVVDGKTLKTKPVSFKVLPPDSNAQPGSNNVRVDDASTQTSDRNVSDKDVFIRIILNKSQAYKEEAIECTMKLYTKYSSISNISATTPPTFDGFLIDDDNSIAQTTDTEHYNGQNYLTAVLKKYIIFPQKTGKLTINSGNYDITVVQYERVNMGFFATSRPVEKTVHVNPGNLSINILPLPEPQPANFSGAVGQFKIDSNLSSSSLRTNEAASLNITISGTGNIKYLKEPHIDFPTEFEQYTPKVDISSRIAGNNVTGSTGIEYTFVPQAVGDFTIPANEFVYFDPSAKKYVTLTTPSYNVKVAKGASSVVESTQQQNIAAKVTDILHIKPGEKNLEKDNRPVIYSVGYWSIYIALIAILIIVVYAYSKHIKLSADVTGMKMAKANKVARRRLKEAKKFLESHSYEKFYEEILKALWGYLSDKLAIPVSQLTRQNISDNLRNYNTPEELINRLIAIIDECEMARYTPSDNDSSVEKMFNEASEVMNEMENIKK